MRLLLVLIFAACPTLLIGQSVSAVDAGFIRSSAAYAEIILRKTELQADLETFLAGYTDANPKVIDLRSEIASLDKSMALIAAVKPTEAGKLTLALGKLIVRHASLDADHSRLSTGHNKDHPDLKRAKRKLEFFDAAIRELLR